MNAKVKNGYAYFNAIPANKVFEATDKDGKAVTDKEGRQVYNIYVDVPREFSRKGEVTVSTSFLKDNPYVEGTKDVSFKEDYEINARVYSFYNKDDKDKNKFEDIKITAGELAAKVNERAEADKAKAAAKEADAPEVEADEPEIE